MWVMDMWARENAVARVFSEAESGSEACMMMRCCKRWLEVERGSAEWKEEALAFSTWGGERLHSLNSTPCIIEFYPSVGPRVVQA